MRRRAADATAAPRPRDPRLPRVRGRRLARTRMRAQRRACARTHACRHAHSARTRRAWRMCGSLGHCAAKHSTHRRSPAPPPPSPSHSLSALPPPEAFLPSVRRSAIAGQTVATFERGLQQLPGALAERLHGRVKLRHTLRSLARRADGRDAVYDLQFDVGGGATAHLLARAVVLAIPAHASARVLAPLAPKAAAMLAAIEYPSVMSVTVVYPREAFRSPEHGKGAFNGFGQLHARAAGLRTLGALYISDLFTGRAPWHEALMVHFVGGAHDAEAATLTDAQLADLTHADARTTLLHAQAARPRVLGIRRWERAIPQANLGQSASLLKRTAYVAHCVLHVARCILYVARCMLHTHPRWHRPAHCMICPDSMLASACAHAQHAVPWERKALSGRPLGMHARTEAMYDSVRAAGLDGLFLSGNALNGVALGNCVQRGEEISAEVLSFVQRGQRRWPDVQAGRWG